ncbi:MAG: hypothetical protein RhofKO_31130 [Rhodothermales bacterium]
MKRLFVTAAVLAVFAVPAAHAQVGLGVSYATDAGQPGAHFLWQAPLTVANLTVGFDINAFLPEKADVGPVEVSTFYATVGGRGQYLFMSPDDGPVGAYGFAGPSLGIAVAETSGAVEASDTSTEIGLNLGGGVIFAERFYGELKYDTGIDQLVLSVGLLLGGD